MTAPPAEAQPMPAGARPTAVVVDDDPDILDLLQIRLERAGFQVFTYPDGLSGGDAVLDMRPHLAILDWMLPGRSGLDICREIRSTPETSSTAILMITARTQEPYREWGYEAGCDRFMTKPFTGPDLLRVTGELMVARAEALEAEQQAEPDGDQDRD